MTKDSLHGYVILFKSTKELVATKRIRIYQREKLADRMNFLVPFDLEDFNRQSDEYPDMSQFTCILQYIGVDGTIHAETLQRKRVDGEIVDYEDNDGNVTHMIYELPIDTSFTLLSGDIKLKLNLQYVDYEASTVSESDDVSAPDPEPKQYVINSDDITVTVLPVADYYSIVPDESLSIINQKIADLQAQQEQLEAAAQVYDQSKADSIELRINRYAQELILTSHGKQVGNAIDLNVLGTEISNWTEDGLIKVITDEDEPEPGPEPTPTDEYADNMVLVVDEHERAIYLTHGGKRIGTPIYLDDLGIAISDADEQGLIKVITDESENNG